MATEFANSFTAGLQGDAHTLQLYHSAIQTHLAQALEAESEANFWTAHHHPRWLPLFYASKERELAKIRDQRAQALGALILLRPLATEHSTVLSNLDSLAPIPPHLLRPPWYLLNLPSLLLVPPLSIYLYSTYRYSLRPFLSNIFSSLRSFFYNWLATPLLDILDTIQSGANSSSYLVHDLTVQADVASLERMSISFLQQQQQPPISSLQDISTHILTTRDISPILDIHTSTLSTQNPLRALVLPPNTLLHTLLIQLQKAKVDLDFALQGISHLLKSQQLTFGFVGVAPAIALLYFSYTAISNLWSGTVGWGKWGGRKRRKQVFILLRRIERILISQLHLHPDIISNQPLGPLPTGLLILSLTKLRSYAISYLPNNSQLRSLFLEDLQDLQDPLLDTRQKLFVVHRMWRCWANSGLAVLLHP